jgi:murein DD-endopeptidase MepM/ murein hydrolase activator NlpD
VEGPITQVFGQTSVTGARHGGIDIGAAEGTVVRAPARGTLSRHSSRDFGQYVVIDHPGTPWYSAYAHLSRYGAEPDAVEEGQVIGYVGSTGLSFGAHLHWAVSTNPQFALDFEQLRDPADFVPAAVFYEADRRLLAMLAAIVAGNGVDAGMDETGHPVRLTGLDGVEFLRREGISLALSISNLNRALLQLETRLDAR